MIKLAIQKAIEGGYSKYLGVGYYLHNRGARSTLFLDPLFWQSLGKALGLKAVGVLTKEDKGELQDGWKFYWHRFIDHLAENKDPEEFFKELLSD